MNLRGALFGLCLALCGFSLVACAVIPRIGTTWHYRMTVTVETPEGVKTGSAVREVYAYRSSMLSAEPGSGFAQISNGEAVLVDLGPRGKLFALMCDASGAPDYAWQVVADAFPYEGGYLTSAGHRYYGNAVLGPVELSEKNYPMFVTFLDLDKPVTVQALKTATTPFQEFPRLTSEKRTFSEVFGAGVTLKSVTLELTKDPVTFYPLENLLPWLPKFYNGRLDGDRLGYADAQHFTANLLASGAFSVRNNKK